jgi:hypothetical protein
MTRRGRKDSRRRRKEGHVMKKLDPSPFHIWAIDASELAGSLSHRCIEHYHVLASWMRTEGFRLHGRDSGDFVSALGQCVICTRRILPIRTYLGPHLLEYGIRGRCDAYDLEKEFSLPANSAYFIMRILADPSEGIIRQITTRLWGHSAPATIREVAVLLGLSESTQDYYVRIAGAR